MRFVIIICFFAVVVLVFKYRLWKMKVVATGYQFCAYVSDFSLLLEKIRRIKSDKSICNVVQAILCDYIKIVYNPNDMKDLFYQLELIIYDIEHLYGEIKGKESCFRSDDWENIQSAYKTFEDCVCSVRYQEWRYGYYKPS